MMKATVAIVFSMLVLFPTFATAGTATQTDWSGGGGFWGVATDWSDEFSVETNIEYYSNPSNITLSRSYEPVEHIVDGEFDGARSVHSADVDGDGDMDVLGAAADGFNNIVWWENSDTAPGIYWTKHTVDVDFYYPVSLYSADIDGDDDMDILATAAYTDGIVWWENDDGSGTSWTEHAVSGGLNGATPSYPVDMDGDGDMDILGASYDNWNIFWWENADGSGTNWNTHYVVTNCLEVISVYPVDINGDGYMDIIGASHGHNIIYWWRNYDGTGTNWTQLLVGWDCFGIYFVHSEDVNGNGDMDVLGAFAYGFNKIAWWHNSGSGFAYSSYRIIDQLNQACCVYSADMDGDGDMDVLGAAYSDVFTWWENKDGSGTSWINHPVGGNGRSIYSEDLDGDGYMDILGAGSDAITWWGLKRTFLSDGSLESSVLNILDSPNWQTLDWTCTEPSGTSVAFQVRASDNASSMGTWSDTLTSPCSLSGILTDGDCYLQYRAILSTTDSLLTPMLDEVTITWNSLGIESGSGSDNYALYGANPNPALSNATLVFSIPVNSRIELSVYDLTGRMVYSSGSEYESGVHEVVLDGLACGVYLVRMVSGEFTATQQFVVID